MGAEILIASQWMRFSVKFPLWPDTFGSRMSQVGCSEVTATLTVPRIDRRQVCRTRARSVTLALVISVFGPFTMAACTSLESATVTEQKMMPAPAPPLVQSTNVIHVLPITGVGGPLPLVLADAVAASLRDSERPAVLSGEANNRGPSVIGKVSKVRNRGSVVWITTKWELRAPYGTIVADRSREIVIDKVLWDRNSVEVVNLIVGDAMPAVVAMVHDHVWPLHVAQQVVVEPPPQSAAAPESVGELSGVPELEPLPTASADTAEPKSELAPEMVKASEQSATEVLVKKTGTVTPMSETVSEPSLPVAASRPPMILAPRPQTASETTPPEIGGLTAEEISAEPTPDNLTPSTDQLQKLESMGKRATEAPPPETRPATPNSAAGVAASPSDTPVVWGRPSFLIRPVRGAPGDGNSALITALRQALRSNDLTVTDDPRQAGYEVVGVVDVGPPVNGRQRARIAWAVKTIGGEEVGKAVQENVIAAGSLNRNWGRVADVVTAAAADGIQQLFEAPRPKYTPVGAVPDFPKILPLPRVPGRALPPPPS